MPGYLFDSTVIIDLARAHSGGPQLVDRLFRETADLYTSSIVTAEVLSGGNDPEQRVISRLLDALEYVAIISEAARWCGLQRRRLRAAARRAPLADALLAATAWGLGATIVTRMPLTSRPSGCPS